MTRSNDSLSLGLGLDTETSRVGDIQNFIITLSEHANPDAYLVFITKDWSREDYVQTMYKLSGCETLLHSSWVEMGKLLLQYLANTIGWNDPKSQAIFLFALREFKYWVIDVFLLNWKQIRFRNLIWRNQSLNHELIRYVCKQGSSRHFLQILKMVFNETLVLDLEINGMTPIIELIEFRANEEMILGFMQQIPLNLLKLDHQTLSNRTCYHAALTNGYWNIFQWLIDKKVPAPRVPQRSVSNVLDFSIAGDESEDEEYDDMELMTEDNETENEKEGLIHNTVTFPKSGAIHQIQQRSKMYETNITNASCSICCDAKTEFALLWCCAYVLCWDCLIKLPKQNRSCPQCRQVVQPWMITRFQTSELEN